MRISQLLGRGTGSALMCSGTLLWVEGRACGLPTIHPGLAHDERKMRSRLALARFWLSELDSPLEITTSSLVEAQRRQWTCTRSHSKTGRRENPR